MSRRIALHKILVDILGSTNVYFQPPSTIQMKHPCIVYERSNEESIHADNLKYNALKRYTVTVVDKDPDSLIPDKIGELPLTSFDRHFVADNLNHDVYSIYF